MRSAPQRAGRLNPMRREWSEPLTIAAFCAFLLFFGLGAFGLTGADEPRYAQIAREMLERGDPVTPVLGGQPWLEKPPLYYWGAMVSYALFGVSDAAARAPVAVLATLMVLFVWFAVERFRRDTLPEKRPGSPALDAALMTVACAGVVGFGRGASTDMPFAAMFTIGMLGWWGWHQTQEKRWLLVFYGAMGLAALAKGPVAAVLAGAIVAAYAVAIRDWKLALRSLWPPGIALFLLVTLPWYMLVQMRNPEFFRIFIIEHNLARMTTDMFRHKQPIWYYVPVLTVAMMPWVAIFILGKIRLAREWMRRGRPGAAAPARFPLFLFLWVAVIFVFFTVSQSKLPGYVLPAVPACTILGADFLWRRRDDEPLGWAAILLHALAAALLTAAVLLYPQITLAKKLGTPPGGYWIAATLGTAIFVGLAATLRWYGIRAVRFVTMVPVILMVAIIIRFDAPVVDATQSARPVARELEKIQSEKLPVAVYRASRVTEYGLHFYRNQPVSRYERDEIPAGAHLVITRTGQREDLEKHLPGRRLVAVGGFPIQKLEYYWVGGPGSAHAGH